MTRCDKIINEIEENTFPQITVCPKCGNNMIRNEDDFDLLKLIVKDKTSKDPGATSERFLFFFHPSIKYRCENCKYETTLNRHGMTL